MLGNSLQAQINEIFESGKKAFNQQEYILAINDFDKCIEQDSLNLHCLEFAGNASLKLGNLYKAKNYFIQAESLDSNNLTILKQLAGIYELEENIPKAIKYYNHLIKLDSTNAIHYRKLGQLFTKSNLLSESLGYFEKAYSINPQDFYTINGLVEILLKNKSCQIADSLLMAAIEQDTFNIRYNLLLAKSKYIQKEYDSTCVVLKKIRGKIDFNNYYSKMYGFALLQIDSLDAAIHYLNNSLVNENNPEKALYYLGSAHEKKEDYKSANHYYAKAIEASTSKDIGLYHRNIARLANEQSDLKKAIFHYKEAYDYSKESVLLYQIAQLSDLYYKDKNIAIRYYKKYINSDHDNTAYKKYAKERSKYLIEQAHLSK